METNGTNGVPDPATEVVTAIAEAQKISAGM
jgi:hypothetical protein